MEQRLIDADALKDDFDRIGFNDYDDYNRALRIIDDAPTIEERPKGKWIELNGHVYDYRCSCCQYISYDEKTNFCPNCGARMER